MKARTIPWRSGDGPLGQQQSPTLECSMKTNRCFFKLDCAPFVWIHYMMKKTPFDEATLHMSCMVTISASGAQIHQMIV